MVDRYTCLTDFNWQDKSRPEIHIEDGDRNIVTLIVGGEHVYDISAISPTDLVDQLDGYIEIFQAAAKHIRGKSNDNE